MSRPSFEEIGRFGPWKRVTSLTPDELDRSQSLPLSLERPRSFTPYTHDLTNSPDQVPGGMATPAPAEDEVYEISGADRAVIIKRNDSEANGEPARRMEERSATQDQTPAHFPLSTHEQLQAMARRREAAVCFKHQVEECRLALKYSVIGWTGTLDPAKIPAALANAPSIRDLDKQMDSLERKLAPFLPPNNNQNSNQNNNNNNNPATSFQGLGTHSLARVGDVRAMLLRVSPGTKSTRHIKPVLDAIEQDARDSGILPPEDNCGWVWSLSFDDWFIWHAGEEEFVSARHDIRTDFVAA